MANKVFECPHKPHLVPTNQLSKIFLKKMKVEDYHYAVCSLLMELLVGPHFGLEVEAFPSIDGDEMFVKMRLPRDDVTLSQYAAHFSYTMPISDQAYESINMQVPHFADHDVRAHTQFILGQGNFFQPFRPSDRIRLLRARLDKYVDL